MEHTAHFRNSFDTCFLICGFQSNHGISNRLHNWWSIDCILCQIDCYSQNCCFQLSDFRSSNTRCTIHQFFQLHGLLPMNPKQKIHCNSNKTVSTIFIITWVGCVWLLVSIHYNSTLIYDAP